MQICRALAGYSYAKADNVRRAMSKKKADAMEAERSAFVNGCVENGIDKHAAEDIYEEMLGFAKYAFNKSHATAYGIISYRTAYLKAHFPAEYFAALLTSVLDNTSKVKEYIADAQRFGISVLSPDINSSSESFTSVGNNIRYGLLAIKNVGRIFVKSLIAERNKAPFKSFDDFVSRLIGSDLNKRTVESMIKCGVFDSFGITRNSLLNCFEAIIDSEHDKLRNNISGQMDLFSFVSADTIDSGGYTYPDIPEFSIRDLLVLERESSGMYFSGHILDSYTSDISRRKPDKISDILKDTASEEGSSDVKYSDRTPVTLAGIVVSKRLKQTKNGETMAFLRIEDRYAEIEVIVFAKQYKLYLELFDEESAICIKGAVSTDEGEEAKILLSSAESLVSNEDYTQVEKQKKEEVEQRLYIKVNDLTDERVKKINIQATLNSGSTQVVLFDSSTRKYSAMRGVKLNICESVMQRLYSIFGQENVILK